LLKYKSNQPNAQLTNDDDMFCKVCKDAGLKEAVYTSHWVRDSHGPSGKVTCPTLLSQKCRYCKKKGHTPKHCPKVNSKYNSTISTVKVSFKPTPTASQEAEENFQQRGRELCSSPPPPPSKTKNYFQLLKVDEETGEETSVTATLKDSYLAISEKRIETFKRECGNTKETELETYKKNLKNNFPSLGEEKTMKIVNAVFTRDQSYSSKVATATTAPVRAQTKREDSPPTTPSPMASRPNTPPCAPKKMPQVKKDDKKLLPNEMRTCSGCGEVCNANVFCTNLYCEGRTPSPHIWQIEEEEKIKAKAKASPPPTTTTTTTTTSRWADMD